MRENLVSMFVSRLVRLEPWPNAEGVDDSGEVTGGRGEDDARPDEAQPLTSRAAGEPRNRPGPRRLA